MVHEVGPPPDPPDRAQLCSDLHGVGHVVEEDEEEIKRNIWRIVRLTHIVLLLLVLWMKKLQGRYDSRVETRWRKKKPSNVDFSPVKDLLQVSSVGPWCGAVNVQCPPACSDFLICLKDHPLLLYPLDPSHPDNVLHSSHSCHFPIAQGGCSKLGG